MFVESLRYFDQYLMYKNFFNLFIVNFLAIRTEVESRNLLITLVTIRQILIILL